jgi:hypothetical protein
MNLLCEVENDHHNGQSAARHHSPEMLGEGGWGGLPCGRGFIAKKMGIIGISRNEGMAAWELLRPMHGLRTHMTR